MFNIVDTVTLPETACSLMYSPSDLDPFSYGIFTSYSDQERSNTIERAEVLILYKDRALFGQNFKFYVEVIQGEFIYLSVDSMINDRPLYTILTCSIQQTNIPKPVV